VALVLREVMEMEVARVAGAERYARTGERAAYRNGYRPRELATRVGKLQLNIRSSASARGTCRVSWRQKALQAGTARRVVGAHLNGISSCKMERLVTQLGLERIRKSTMADLPSDHQCSPGAAERRGR